MPTVAAKLTNAPFVTTRPWVVPAPRPTFIVPSPLTVALLVPVTERVCVDVT